MVESLDPVFSTPANRFVEDSIRQNDHTMLFVGMRRLKADYRLCRRAPFLSRKHSDLGGEKNQKNRCYTCSESNDSIRTSDTTSHDELRVALDVVRAWHCTKRPQTSRIHRMRAGFRSPRRSRHTKMLVDRNTASRYVQFRAANMIGTARRTYRSYGIKDLLVGRYKDN
jgi:hypothetical protein